MIIKPPPPLASPPALQRAQKFLLRREFRYNIFVKSHAPGLAGPGSGPGEDLGIQPVFIFSPVTRIDQVAQGVREFLVKYGLDVADIAGGGEVQGKHDRREGFRPPHRPPKKAGGA